MSDGVVTAKEIADRYERGEITIADVRAQYGYVMARYLLLAKYAVERHTACRALTILLRCSSLTNGVRTILPALKRLNLPRASLKLVWM